MSSRYQRKESRVKRHVFKDSSPLISQKFSGISILCIFPNNQSLRPKIFGISWQVLLYRVFEH